MGDRGDEESMARKLRGPANRRAWLKKTAMLAGGMAGYAVSPEITNEGMQASAAQARSAGGGSAFTIASDSKAVVETTAGRIRGYIRNGVLTFKGVPYAGSTEGAARFMRPTKPAPWAGVRSSMSYGPMCPQKPRPEWGLDEYGFVFEYNDAWQSEECLRLNVWTPGVDGNRKRPVMFWIHGGGYSGSSGQDLNCYDGENLSRRGDAVVVAVTHRLNAFGFLNLAEYGEEYAGSGNAGMLDLVAALEWVRDNIGNFGGDPGNVEIFGQSGGGGKVGVLMAMPAAKGLFHRAVIQSGSSLRQLTPDVSGRLAAAVLTELGLGRSQLAQLKTLPHAQLAQAGADAVRKLTAEPGLLPAGGWAPTVDGKILPTHSFDPVAPAISANIPLIVGTVLNDSMNGIGHPEYEAMTMDEVRTRAGQRFGGKSEGIIEVFRRAHPEAKPFDLLSLMLAAPVRQNAITQAERKTALRAAPAYLYWFVWKTPILDGRPRAFHGCEIPFVLCNTDRAAAMTGGTGEARELSAKVSDAWINFARKGDPNHSGLPKWPVFTPDNVETMVFGRRCEMRRDPDREERQSINQA